MKKTSLKIGTMLLAFALIFAGCSNSSSGSGSGSGSGTDTTTDTVVLSDGIWTVRVTTTTTGNLPTGGTGTAQVLMTLKANVSNNDYTFTSGTQKITMNTAEIMGDNYSTYQALPSDMKEYFKQEYTSGLRSSIPAEMGTVNSVDFNDSTISITIDMSQASLASAKQNLNLADLPEGTDIRTNQDRTSYSFSITNNGVPMNIVAEKD